ncbi:MAG: hypothetical protein GKR93_19905 [Gammaproteobacteria bacterium]|nr:hypothetical protein [Gammaproteobacteria bacterium]
MTDQLHQINISHDTKQDRLLLRISTTGGDEYRLWLTRRYTNLLLGVLNKEIDNQGGAPSVAGSEETTKMLKNGALEKKYDSENTKTFPLNEEGVLAFRINARNTEEGNLALELLPEEGKGITLNLNKSLLYMFHNVLTQGITQASWGLQTEISASMKVH